MILLGLSPDNYLYLNNIGQMLLDNKRLFLSKRAIQSFGGYADAQLRRLQNALARDTFPQSEKEQHIFNSVKNAMYSFNSSSNVVKDYDKIGKRNKKKDDLHLNKHAMHLMRLFMMAIDILEKGEINTYREKEHDLLMDIRFGKYQTDEGTFSDSFYDMMREYERRLHYVAEHTDLPAKPDFKRVQELVMTINERVIRDEI